MHILLIGATIANYCRIRIMASLPHVTIIPSSALGHESLFLMSNSFAPLIWTLPTLGRGSDVILETPVLLLLPVGVIWSHIAASRYQGAQLQAIGAMEFSIRFDIEE